MIRVGSRDTAGSTAAARTGTPAGAVIPVSAEIVLGRDSAHADVLLSHPAVSRRHVLLKPNARGILALDLESTNGVWINGRRIASEQVIEIGDTFDIGPFSWVCRGTDLLPRDIGREPRIEARRLEKRVLVDGSPRPLLDGVSLDVGDSEFTAILGPSGCGKSTLIRLLSGRSRPTDGTVRYAGRDLMRHFELLKHTIAFVPQRETLPEDLVLESSLRFTARLRLPADSTSDDCDDAIEEALERVGLSAQREQRMNQLSGGQRKRAALANELLARPGVLFLDEVTSGLDEATDGEMMALFAALAQQGITVVCVTHTVANVPGNCDRIVVMATGGHIAYDGPPQDALQWFDCPSLSRIYPALASVSGADWAARCRTAGRTPDALATDVALTVDDAPARAERPDRRTPLAQLPVLLERNLAITMADVKSLAFILAQAVAIGLLFRLVFGAGQPAGPLEMQFAFLLGVSSFWFGCSSGSKEIVKERPLFELERDVNLRIPGYVLSKIATLALVGGVQVVLMHGVIAAAGVRVAHVGELLLLNLLVVVVGSSLGLAISAFSERESQAATLVPLALIPQILLSAAVVPDLPGAAERLAQGVVAAYWMYRAQRSLYGVPEIDGDTAVLILLLYLALYLAVTILTLHIAGKRNR